VEPIWSAYPKTLPIKLTTTRVVSPTGMKIREPEFGTNGTVRLPLTTKSGFPLAHSPRPVLKIPKSTTKPITSSTQREISPQSTEKFTCSKLIYQRLAALMCTTNCKLWQATKLLIPVIHQSVTLASQFLTTSGFPSFTDTWYLKAPKSSLFPVRS
jgi:hypothetical protein